MDTVTDGALERYRQCWGSPCLRLFDIDCDAEYANPTAPNVYVPPREMHQLLTQAVGCDN